MNHRISVLQLQPLSKYLYRGVVKVNSNICVFNCIPIVNSHSISQIRNLKSGKMELEDLKILQCPQNWDLDDYNEILESLLKKHVTPEEKEDGTLYATQIKMFLFYVRLSYETYRVGQYNDALEYLNKSDDITDDFMSLYDKPFKHVSQASKAHILFKMNSIKEAKEILDELKDQSFSEKERAGLLYMESMVVSGYDFDRAIKLIGSAVSIVPDEAEFNFMLGLLIGKKRRRTVFPTPQPSQKEFDACRKGVTLKRNIPHYSVTLAKMYMDVGFSLPFHKKKEYKNLAASLYRGLLQYHNSLSGNDIARCIFNLTKIQFNSDLEQYCELALKKSDSVLVNHYVGSFYVRNQQLKKACECLKKTVSTLSYVSSLVLLLMYRLNKNSLCDDDIESYVNDLVKAPKEPDFNQSMMYLSVSEFYCLVKRDINKASKYFLLASKEKDITEPHYINIIKIPLQSYLCILKAELLSCNLNNEVIKEAITVLKALPNEVMTPKQSSSKYQSAFELQMMLKC